MPEQDEKLAFVVKVFEHLRTLTSHADGKAGIAIGLQTFLLTNVLGVALVGNTFRNLHLLDPSGRVVFYALGTAFCLASVMCVVFCILVFTPRKPEEASELERKGLTYFEQISRFKSSADYDLAVKKASNQELITEFSHQNYALAVTLKHKMKYARYSVNALLLSILFGVLLLFFALTR